MLNLKAYQDLSFVKEVKNFILGKAKSKLQLEELNILTNILDNKTCGFFINERSMNLPLELIPPLLNILTTDISGYKEDNPTSELFDVEYIVLLSK